MGNEFSGTAHGPVVQAGHIERVELHYQQTVTHLRQLPPAVRLLGREAELAGLRATAETGPPAIVVTGPPWAGKSALAVAFAHEIADRFPDGQLCLDLGSVTAEEALGWALRSLGTPQGGVPDTLPHLVSAYRSALTGKRMLVLLDNFADPSVVELFTTSTGLVLATGRGAPVFASSTAKLALGPLSHEDSVALLRREAPDAYWCDDDADRLARLCGGLPLALIGVAHELNTTRFSPRGVADMLSDGRLPLSALPLHLRDSLALSLQRLPDVARLAFRRLGPFPGDTITTEVLAAVAGTDSVEPEDIARALVAEGLLVEAWRGGTTTLLTPFRLLATELLTAEERDQVLDQILDHYVDESKLALSAWLGDHAPEVDDEDSAMARRIGRGFIIGEAKNMMRLLERTTTRRVDAAVGLAIPLIEHFIRQEGDGELDTVHDLLLDAVTGQAEDYRNAYNLLFSLNKMYVRVGRPKLGQDCLAEAQRVARDAGDDQRRLEATQRLNAAFETRLADAWDSGDLDQVANSQVLLAGTHEELGNPGLARELLLEALAHYRTTGNSRDIAETLNALGDVSRDLGLLAESCQVLRESVRRYEQTDDRDGLALALDSLAETLDELGLHDEASSAQARSDALLDIRE